jgi:hypothetical protein
MVYAYKELILRQDDFEFRVEEAKTLQQGQLWTEQATPTEETVEVTLTSNQSFLEGLEIKREFLPESFHPRVSESILSFILF